MCASCLGKPSDVHDAVTDRVDGGMTIDQAVRATIIQRAADSAESIEWGCAGWVLIQQIYPDVRWEEWRTRDGDVPTCNEESLRGVDHTDECGANKCDSQYSCCGFCPECDTHHADGEDGNIDGDDYCSHCGRCADCGHACSDY